MKTLSVAMATYNGANFLPEQLASIAQQSRAPNELVVVDDASQDRTLSLLENFKHVAPFPVRIIPNPQNIGSTASFNLAVAACDGDFIALTDQDDRWFPERLARQSAILEASPEVGATFCNARLRYEGITNPRYTTAFEYYGLDTKTIRKIRERGSRVYFDTRFVIGATLTFRSDYRSLVLPIPPVDMQLPRYFHDAWIVSLISTQAEILADESTLLEYRLHGDQQVGMKSTQRQPILRRRNPSLALTRDALVRLQQGGHQFPHSNSATLTYLDKRYSHFLLRSDLPKRPHVRKISGVLQELSLGRYHRHSLGFRSAVGDLIRSNLTEV